LAEYGARTAKLEARVGGADPEERSEGARPACSPFGFARFHISSLLTPAENDKIRRPSCTGMGSDEENGRKEVVRRRRWDSTCAVEDDDEGKFLPF
jgi:hypothetical protein